MGWRVPAYTRLAPRDSASVTSACPMPRLAPVTRTVLPLIVMSAPPARRCSCGFRAACLALTDIDQPDSGESPRTARDFQIFLAGPSRVLVLGAARSEEHTSELQSLRHLVCR